MTYQFHPPDASVLKDKVVVLTGGAIGIGGATVRLLHSHGANVFFGDVLDEPALSLESELSSGPGTVKFVHCDVTSYSDNLKLFDAAFQKHGRVDHAWANAGIVEQGNIINPELDLESVKEEPTKGLSVLDINLKGPIYFARIASVYLRQNAKEGEDKSLTLTSSVGGFREDPGLWVYVPTKHGIMGLMRVLRGAMMQSKPVPIRTNSINPYMTATRITAGAEGPWEAAGLPMNSPEDVAKIVVGVMADTETAGAAMYIEGGRAWNIEEGILATRSQWLGERQEADCDKGTALLGAGEGWRGLKKNKK